MVNNNVCLPTDVVVKYEKDVNPFPVYLENTQRLKIVTQRLPRDNLQLSKQAAAALFIQRKLVHPYLFNVDKVSSDLYFYARR